ncbi:hypothetical protein PVAND_008211 [Polypedilum vanderplanki]|uniref:non-specific serine/threonine protein kinase n=1 Tax=Polypedilum vanderplanki TaxID=319348 RepID=A0A9J6C9I2_POLVA|nr:hypothetical protein PVAND_008211 [Polypedilum vanderplanki]
MTTKESYKDRQENELEVLKSIFGDDVVDLRKKEEKWMPLDLTIKLKPQRDSKISQAYCHIELHVICPKNYPKVCPKLSLENAKGLANSDVVTLLNQINKEAYGLKGEVMIFEICQFIQSFLHERNVPPKGSFYDEMLATKQKRDQDELTQQKEIEEKKRQHIQDEILKRKEQLRKENRIRKGTTTDSPLHHISSESSNSDSKFVNEICDEHNCSENLYFPNDGRKILKGTCIGHSMKGCINFSGIDLTSGRLFYITEWTIKYSLLESKNLKADEVIENIEKMMACLIKLRHKYLVAYDSVSCTKRKDSIMVILLQEFLYGISICNMSTIWNWSAECTSNIAKCVLEALVFLHNNGVSHGNLLDTSVFIDATGNIKVSDYSIVTYLQELTTGVQASLSDLYSLGSFIESLMPTPHFEMKSFINECKSERTLSASDLLEHPFLYTALINHDNSQSPHDNKIVSYPPPVAQNFTTPYCIPPLISSNNSRLETEFEIINYIGRGAYGDVLKCRNILDNRQYAIKRVPLSSNNKQIFKKMTREVELLSRLNHENVVRYFNSWIEIQSTKIPALLGSDDEYSEKSRKKSSIIKTHSHNRLTIPDYSDEEDDNDSLGLGWNTFSDDSSNEDSDDGIEFVDSRGNAVQYESDDDCINDEKEKGGKGSSGKKEKEIVLYIQMEYCEKSTLRLAIDANLYLDKERYWKLFREIVEGLYHIHQQGMIHRDLKCENIFLDSRDHIKIADFGLATTNVLALQNRIVEANQSLKANQISYGDSHTGQVGTALYVAPELSGKASRSTYNQKVDVFSLGIIFFEMITPPLKTGMERITTILKLRQPDIILPKYLEDDNYKNEKQILKWLLNHNPSSRPTSEELLQSELMPPVKMEANELQDMLRHVLANPQSRSYKHLINKMMLQECDDVIQFCYHQQVLLQSPSVFENAKSKIEEVFRKHGAIDIQTPLLTPYTKSDPEYITRLMTHSGLIVTLPHDLNTLFLRYVAANGINLLRRYSIGRVYRERKLFNSHPKQNYEVEFNVVTPNRGNFLVDAELCVVAHEIISEFDVLKQKNLSFAINHTSLLRAIFLYYSVPTSKYKNILALTADYLEGRIKTKYQLQTSITSLIPAVKSISSLIDTLLITDIPITNIASTNLKVLVRGRGEAAALAKGALRELETVINLSQAMGVTTPINLYVSLSLNQDCSRTGSIVWQLLGDGPKPGKQIVFAHGGRYDSIIEDYKKLMQKGASLISREIYCAGFTFAIEKLVTSLNQLSNAITYRSTVDLLFYVTGTRPPLKEICHLLKSFWNAGHKCCYIESPNNQVDEDVARDLGANHILVLGEDGCLRIKTWQIDRYDENTVSKAEALNYLKKNLSMDINTLSIEQNFSTRNNSLTNIPIENINAGLPFFEINFITNEKITSNKKKRLVNQIEQKLSSVMKRFSKRETFVIFVVELDAHQIRSLISCIDPDPKQQSQNDFDVLQKMLPKNKQKYIQEVYDEITDKIAQNKNIIVGMFGIQDSYYRIIL